ncbi:hypothetical protein PPL_05947 [Heterostelium album PN500]|uniref:Bromo domain-containing protein n=1 Tax=Heterostelium pallidum (strain ATCC 26659 / Pp 5 / PN500) TaxID=670386 RepID=D3BBS8_HETP5|nr:hypothetical protein PPL_05947 [Heterostelium album PN500]EFA81111.1 hypothetical protein PPL_05947 [Heterostelium album PN500]|eukprot:XP_020433229.1 hypothetical protein PPL_05947 [Heterostelium album PN500]
MQSTDLNNFLNTDDQSVNIITDSITSDINSNNSLSKEFHVPIIQPVTTKQPLLGPEGGIENQPAQAVTSAWKEKELGILRFEVITNDSSLRNLELLMNLKNSHPEAWPFLQPVSIDVAPNYYEVIKDPVDISKVEQRLSTGTYYITKYMFIADLKRMCENCRQFNGEGSYFHIANRLEQFIIQQCQSLP